MFNHGVLRIDPMPTMYEPDAGWHIPWQTYDLAIIHVSAASTEKSVVRLCHVPGVGLFTLSKLLTPQLSEYHGHTICKRLQE
jgi:hypothetical protein